MDMPLILSCVNWEHPNIMNTWSGETSQKERSRKKGPKGMGLNSPSLAPPVIEVWCKQVEASLVAVTHRK